MFSSTRKFDEGFAVTYTIRTTYSLFDRMKYASRNDVTGHTCVKSTSIFCEMIARQSNGDVRNAVRILEGVKPRNSLLRMHSHLRTDRTYSTCCARIR